MADINSGTWGGTILEELGNTSSVQEFKGIFGGNKQQHEIYGTPDTSFSGPKQVTSITANFIDRAVNSVEDPAFNRFLLNIVTYEETGLFADEKFEGSAIAYLKRTGEIERAEKLIKVREMIIEMLSSKNYVIQDLQGFGALNDNYRKIGVESKVTMTLLDDVRWSTWFIMYTLNWIFYDPIKQIEILPINLRRFTAWFYICDVRDLSPQALSANEIESKRRSKLAAGTQITQAEIQEITDKQDYQMFTLNGSVQNFIVEIPCCYINTAVVPDAISNIEPAEMKHQLSFSFKAYSVKAVFPVASSAIDEVRSSEINYSKVGDEYPGLWDIIKDTAKQLIATTIAGYADAIIQNTKAWAMNKIYEFAEETGIIKGINDATSLFKPNLTIQQGINEVKKQVAYWEETRYANSYSSRSTVRDTQYKRSLGRIQR